MSGFVSGLQARREGHAVSDTGAWGWGARAETGDLRVYLFSVPAGFDSMHVC